jgi:type II secretory ATPase GspE/PulE/Tfp pilus assembly ATPase PilB-like protein
MDNFGSLVLGQISAKLPEEGGFFSLVKIIVMLVCMFLWAWPAGWVCRDVRRLGIGEYKWGTFIAGCGVVGWFCWIILPVFWLGLVFFFVLSCGSVLGYAIYRDSIVEEESKILKPANIAKAIRGESSAEFHVEQKVRLKTPAGTEIKIPPEPEQQKIYQMFQDLVFDGLWRRCSDIYLLPKGEESRVLFRIDGVTSEYTTYDRKLGQTLIDYAKSISELNANERRQPQRAKLLAQQIDVDRKLNLDIETSGSRAGERLTIKIRAEEAKLIIEDAGFSREQLERFARAIDAKQGLVVFSGLSGSGLSTSLYACARSHDAFTQNIHTLEVNRLMDLENITQNIHDPGGEQTFARMLQSVSRREPDVIMVDPCPDSETMQMIGKVISGKKKKICTTLRASSALSALNRTVRWLDDAELASDMLIAVTFQRLARKLCPACREAYRPNTATLRKLNLSTKSEVTFYRPPQPVVDKKGNPILCPTCQGTGYLGRTAIFEMIIVDDLLREAIRTGDATKLKAAARKGGLKYWQEAAMDQVIAGVTSVQEIIRVNKESQAETQAKA